jgi:hypothetical protein
VFQTLRISEVENLSQQGFQTFSGSDLPEIPIEPIPILYEDEHNPAPKSVTAKEL